VSDGTYSDIHSFPTRRSSDLADVQSSHRAAALVHRDADRDAPRAVDRRAPAHARAEPLRRAPRVDARDAPVRDARSVPTLTRGADRKSTRLNSSHVEISYAVF